MSKEDVERNRLGVWANKLDKKAYHSVSLARLLGGTKQLWNVILNRDKDKYPLPELTDGQ